MQYLRNACRVIAILGLILVAATVGSNLYNLITKHEFSFYTIVDVILHTIPDVALLYGAQREKHWYVLVWVVKAIVLVIYLTVQIFLLSREFFDNSDSHSDGSNMMRSVHGSTILMVVYVICGIIVLKYWHQLRFKNTNDGRVTYASVPQRQVLVQGQNIPQGQYIPQGQNMSQGQYIPQEQNMSQGQYIPQGQNMTQGQYIPQVQNKPQVL